MPYYYSEAATADGKIRKRVLKAFDEKDADRQLRKLGLHPMLIESTERIRQRKQEKALHTRHIIRNTMLTVVAISLIGGIAGYLVLLDLKSGQSAVPRGIKTRAPDINLGDTPEERKYAKYVNDLLFKNFPGLFRAVSIESKSLMLVYENEERERLDSDVEESIVAMLARGFQRQFKQKRCDVYLMRNGKEVAGGRFQYGKVTTWVE